MLLLNWKSAEDPRDSFSPFDAEATEAYASFDFGDVAARVYSKRDILQLSAHSDTDHPFLRGKPNSLSNVVFDPANSSRVGIIGGQNEIHVRIAGSECEVVQSNEDGIVCRRGRFLARCFATFGHDPTKATCVRVSLRSVYSPWLLARSFSVRTVLRRW